jgi:CelD/BcsL family acetyltransferase involved in cellulose biosynthesis
LATASNTDEFMADLIRLHQERWTGDGQPGCFAAARFAEFHRRLAQQWVPSGRAVLARLSHEGNVYGVLYGFISRNKCDFYQSGIARTDAGPFDSPGTTANLLLMRALAERGITAYDFLRGSSGYKERLATYENALVSIRIRRRTLRSALYRSVRLGARVVRRGIKLVSQK